MRLSKIFSICCQTESRLFLALIFHIHNSLSKDIEKKKTNIHSTRLVFCLEPHIKASCGITWGTEAVSKMGACTLWLKATTWLEIMRETEHRIEIKFSNKIMLYTPARTTGIFSLRSSPVDSELLRYLYSCNSCNTWKILRGLLSAWVLTLSTFWQTFNPSLSLW